ncbi:hypothetical protein SDRG_00567 [Saprolegnia diclina VS20]|uniref:E3 ubiquitin-protein ligase n=1 Tax=Saprolegnia diclina (strain VS20) TaxID=1156394 RepID=T0SBQ0_SAPDV|nr:hypothetical protein SDRG_00567 [Saprolegnia diclina VS20]EQC42848.1 hypothetical protein SDRG_00567 [Saprolegnia diclina VS20]|eukprot:XP_008604271.1 hypothetical protein SDRG_00567 [Saprolegnia diclina VS20]
MSHLASPSALGRYVEDRLRHGLEPVLEAGWIVSLLAYGHKPERFPDFAEAALHAAIRVADGGSFPNVAAYLRHVHEAHALTMPKRMCGYMFQQNDISWSCRDCEMDETCVQCQSCFEASDHDGHQVFFHRTSPGGMCDCGDTEAWQVHGMCPAHRVQSSDLEVVETPLELPPPLTATIVDVLRELIVYMVDVAGRATNNHDPTKIEARLKPKKRKHSDDDLPTLYHVRISNDDVHTDQDLTGSLIDKGYSLEFAEAFTQSVDADGAALLKEKVLLPEALSLMQAMEAEGWLASVVDDDHLAREAIVVHLFSYVHGLARLSPTLQQSLFGLLFEPVACIEKVYPHVSSDMEPIVELLTATSVLPKAIVTALHSAYLNLMGDRTLKWQFALFYVEVYQLVMREYFCGVGTKNEAMFGLSVQIFTTPSIVPQLVDDKGLLPMLLHVLGEGLELTKVDDALQTPMRVINLDHIVVRFTRYEPVITDLGFVLLVPSIAHAFLEHLGAWARLLVDASHLNAQVRVRESEAHIELEDNMPWYNALMLHLSLASVTESFFKGLRMAKQGLDETTAALIWDGLWPALTAHASRRRYHTVADQRLVQFDVAAEPVSLHHPLHQAIGLFVLEVLAAGTFDVAAFATARVQNVDEWDSLLEYPLRSLVLSAQIASHLWVRNGQELMTHEATSYADQAYYFPNLTAHVSFRDVDLALLQFGAVVLGPRAFLARFLDRYGVASYLAGPTVRPWTPEKQTQLVSQSLLHLLWLLTELPPPSTTGAEVALRRKLVHLLLYQPCNYSTLRDEAASVYAYPGYEALPEDTRNKQLQSVLDAIAESPSAAIDSIAPAKYVLKHAVYTEYDPACLHLSPSRHIKAQEARHDVVFKNWRDTPLPLVAALPLPHPHMARVRDLALTPDLLAVLRHCLRDAHLGADETVLTRVVHLLTLQLHVLAASSERDAATAALMPELTMAATPTDERLGLPLPSGTHAPCGDGSLVQLLAAHATRLRALGEASLTPLLAGILYVLNAYAAMDAAMARFLAADVLRVVTTRTNGPLDAKARLALQKHKQQQAMAAMLARQSQFATTLLEAEDDVEAEAERPDETLLEQLPPECIICAHAKKDDPVVYIGLAQRIGRPQSCETAIHVQLCGHAVHLSCVEQYRSTIRRDTDASLLSAVAFDAAHGEFLCPLCKALSSTTVPYVPRAPSTSGHAMEAFFQGASSVDSVLLHLTSLPSRLRSSPLPSLPTLARDAMHAFVESLQMPLTSAAATVLDTVADAFAAAETQGLSDALLHVAYAPEAVAVHRLGVDLPPDADVCLDALTPRDDAKLEALRLVLQLLPALLPSTYAGAVPNALAAALEGSAPTSDVLAALTAPLLSQDLFRSLLLTCAVVQDKAEMLWTIRAFAVLQMVQALVQTTTACPDALPRDVTVTSVDGWRASLGLPIAATAPSGSMLQAVFESTVLGFLRKATLVARAVFRGADDPDAGLYLNFVSTLRGSSSLPSLCQQLGVPLPADVFGSKAFGTWIAPMLGAAQVPALPLVLVRSVPWVWHVHSTLLPPKYTDLYALHSGHRCPSTSLPMETTALCLRCGVAVCAGSDCCKVDGQGACSRHVAHCGHGNGAFFLLKACSVLLVSVHGRACFFTSPYVDEFGEEDIYVKRGRPLHRRFKRLALLVQLVAGHGIAPEVSKVRRTSDQYIRTYYY